VGIEAYGFGSFGGMYGRFRHGSSTFGSKIKNASEALRERRLETELRSPNSDATG
jgi:hypothetical protein